MNSINHVYTLETKGVKLKDVTALFLVIIFLG